MESPLRANTAVIPANPGFLLSIAHKTKDHAACQLDKTDLFNIFV
jgi:hypothetical protein